VAVSFTLRAPQAGEARALAAFHLKIWRQTYQAMVPPEALQILDLERRVTRWRAMLEQPRSGFLLQTFLCGDEYAGFCYAGAAGLPLFGSRGEVHYLYVDPKWQGHGIGRRLLGIAARHFLSEGRKGLGLGVVSGNQKAIGFYQAMGGVAGPAYTDPGPVWRSSNIAYFWDDLPALINRSGPAETVFS
jgi:ribosomal protein S18 acetylase RimI-like enzyme